MRRSRLTALLLSAVVAMPPAAAAQPADQIGDIEEGGSPHLDITRVRTGTLPDRRPWVEVTFREPWPPPDDLFSWFAGVFTEGRDVAIGGVTQRRAGERVTFLVGAEGDLELLVTDEGAAVFVFPRATRRSFRRNGFTISAGMQREEDDVQATDDYASTDQPARFESSIEDLPGLAGESGDPGRDGGASTGGEERGGDVTPLLLVLLGLAGAAALGASGVMIARRPRGEPSIAGVERAAGPGAKAGPRRASGRSPAEGPGSERSSSRKATGKRSSSGKAARKRSSSGKAARKRSSSGKAAGKRSGAHRKKAASRRAGGGGDRAPKRSGGKKG